MKNILPNKNFLSFNLAGYNSPTKIFFCLTLLAGVGVFGSAIYQGFLLELSQLLVLLVTLTVAALAGQYCLSVPPQKRIKITFGELIVFWAILWLGTPQGVLAAAVGAIAYALTDENSTDKKRGFFDASVAVIAALGAGSIFYFILNYGSGFAQNAVAANSVRFGWFAAAAVSMILAHYVLSSALTSAFLSLRNERPFVEIWKGNFSLTSVNYSFAATAVFALHCAFLEFGLFFGLVILAFAVVGHLAYRIHVARLTQKTREISEASRVHLATVEALATAIDARDQVGIGHVRRTQIYAVGIGKILNLSDGDLQALNTGALLHDIGKLAIPDHILNKPGRLTPAEVEKTKIHVSVGASILERVNFSYPVLPTVKYHHEMWDGSGYPEGLEKEDIPLTARVLAVADAYDTLRNARPYRPQVSREDARKFLLNNAGTQFDPKIVDVFLRNMRQLEAEAEAQGFSYASDETHSNIVFSCSDKNDRQGYVEQIKRANREVFSLYELARVFSSSLDLEDTLCLFVEKIGEFVPFDSCVVYLSSDGEQARAAHAAGKNSEILGAKTIKSGEGASGFVLAKRQPVIDVDPALDFAFDQAELAEEYAGMISFPLVADNKLLGAVSLYSCVIETYEEEHLRLLETLARIASDAIRTSQQHAATESKALTDPMTGLPNARSLQIQFEKETARAGRTGSNFQLLMLDLDGFKAVNDTFGHKTGDKLLKEISKVMRGELREYDFLARYAGDEFVIIAPEMSDDGVADLCKRMERAVGDFKLLVDGGSGAENGVARVGVSLGAASYPQHGETLDQIVIAADKAMYGVKYERKKKKIQTPKTPPRRLPLVEATILSTPEFTNKPVNSTAAKTAKTDGFVIEIDESHIISSAAIN